MCIRDSLDLFCVLLVVVPLVLAELVLVCVVAVEVVLSLAFFCFHTLKYALGTRCTEKAGFLARLLHPLGDCELVGRIRQCQPPRPSRADRVVRITRMESVLKGRSGDCLQLCSQYPPLTLPKAAAAGRPCIPQTMRWEGAESDKEGFFSAIRKETQPPGGGLRQSESCDVCPRDDSNI